MKYVIRKGQLFGKGPGDTLLKSEWNTISQPKQQRLLDQRFVLEVPDGVKPDVAGQLKVTPNPGNARVNRVNQRGVLRKVVKDGRRLRASVELGFKQGMGGETWRGVVPLAERKRALEQGVVIEDDEGVIGNYHDEKKHTTPSYKWEQMDEPLNVGMEITDEQWWENYSADERFRLAYRGVVDVVEELETASVT